MMRAETICGKFENLLFNNNKMYLCAAELGMIDDALDLAEILNLTIYYFDNQMYFDIEELTNPHQGSFPYAHKMILRAIEKMPDVSAIIQGEA